jgi:alkylation response protein AidB-like acyl-CoA dehydrogenase
MEFTFTKEQEAVRAEVAAFLDAERGSFEPACDNWLVGFDRAFSQKLAERGWIGITWPVEHRGAEAALPARDPAGRGHLRHRNVGAGGGQRPGRRPHPGRA